MTNTHLHAEAQQQKEFVIPAKAWIQPRLTKSTTLDSGLRRNDDDVVARPSHNQKPHPKP
ncbi:MAG TPA: hypothetical protein VLC92_15200 [Rhodocyclaceae bacterium]|nr:hypothetical protein [Rhodocyclaceae bacterium]